MGNCSWLMALFAAAVWGLTWNFPPPAKIVVIAFWIFVVVKFRAMQRINVRPVNELSTAEVLQWFFLTPTLDADRFFGTLSAITPRPETGQWAFATFKTVVGAILFFIVAGQLVHSHHVVAGWVAMVGIVMMLHFGFLELVVLWWQSRGRDIRPLMQQPLQASSLREFWGQRWNTAFRDFAHQQIFRPLCRHSNARVATLASFLFSGAVHELAISVPASSGYGMPFAYLVIQWMGITVERNASQRGWPLRSAGCRWIRRPRHRGLRIVVSAVCRGTGIRRTTCPRSLWFHLRLLGNPPDHSVVLL